MKKSVLFLAAVLAFSKLCLAQKEVEEILTKPRVKLEEEKSENFLEERGQNENHKSVDISEITPEPDNPIAPAGISLEEFFDFGMVHVENDILMLLQAGQGKVENKKKEGPQSFYMHRVITGYQTVVDGRGSSGDPTSETTDSIEDEGNGIDEEGERESEEDDDFPQLASRNKRS